MMAITKTTFAPARDLRHDAPPPIADGMPPRGLSDGQGMANSGTRPQPVRNSGQKSLKEDCSPNVLSMANIFFATSSLIAIVVQAMNFSSICAFVIGTWTDPVG